MSESPSDLIINRKRKRSTMPPKKKKPKKKTKLSSDDITFDDSGSDIVHLANHTPHIDNMGGTNVYRESIVNRSMVVDVNAHNQLSTASLFGTENIADGEMTADIESPKGLSSEPRSYIPFDLCMKTHRSLLLEVSEYDEEDSYGDIDDDTGTRNTPSGDTVTDHQRVALDKRKLNAIKSILEKTTDDNITEALRSIKGLVRRPKEDLPEHCFLCIMGNAKFDAIRAKPAAALRNIVNTMIGKASFDAIGHIAHLFFKNKIFPTLKPENRIMLTPKMIRDHLLFHNLDPRIFHARIIMSERQNYEFLRDQLYYKEGDQISTDGQTFKLMNERLNLLIKLYNLSPTKMAFNNADDNIDTSKMGNFFNFMTELKKPY
jgi:hypothetical protein